ncbi:MAG TPA: SRPBCC family protein [Gemmatimonadaceae bacterium]|nr:SRPBCC family protein [Gemmatimonadaceae bacterium]
MPSDREIIVERTIGGPPEIVFKAYTDVRHLARWWGPDGFTTTTSAFEFRVGGAWEFVMHGPDGTDYPNHIEYREIVPAERIVFVHGERQGDPEAFVSTITFAARDGGAATDVVMRAVFKDKATRDKVVTEFGAIEGGKQTLAHLDDYVRTLSTVGAGSE